MQSTTINRPQWRSSGTGPSSARPGLRMAEWLKVRSALPFLVPYLALLTIFHYVPIFMMARDSFTEFTLFNPDLATFVGAKNYVRVFTDPSTLQSLGVTLLFMVGVVVLVVPCSFLLAVYLNGRLPARALLRTMIFLPVVTSTVVVSTLWLFLLNQNGLVNSILASAGMPILPFLTDKAFALPAVIVMTTWQQVGLATVLFLGGLQSIPNELLEAASIDGAGPLRRLWDVTIPLLSRTTLFVVVVMTVFSMQAFAPAYVMTGGGPEGTTNTILHHIYRTAFYMQEPGFASAMTMVLVVFALGISLLQMWLLRTRWNY